MNSNFGLDASKLLPSAEEKPLMSDIASNEHVFKNEEAQFILLSNLLNLFHSGWSKVYGGFCIGTHGYLLHL